MWNFWLIAIFRFLANSMLQILKSVKFEMVFQASSGFRWLFGRILSEKLVFWRSVDLMVPFLDHSDHILHKTHSED